MSKSTKRDYVLQNCVIYDTQKSSKSRMKYDYLNNIKKIHTRKEKHGLTQTDKIEKSRTELSYSCDVTIILSVKEFHITIFKF